MTLASWIYSRLKRHRDFLTAQALVHLAVEVLRALGYPSRSESVLCRIRAAALGALLWQ